MNLTARRDPKDLQAACDSKAIAQMKMLMLIDVVLRCWAVRKRTEHTSSIFQLEAFAKPDFEDTNESVWGQ